MTAGELVTESREVYNFDRVALRIFGELAITQGEEECLTIETRQDVLRRVKSEVKDGRLVISVAGSWLDKVGQALSTSFTGRPVKCNLILKELRGLEISGAGRVRASSIETDRLVLKLSGAGDVRIESFTAEVLEVDLPGAGRIGLTGQVAEQSVVIRGAGGYSAPKLESKKARVEIGGAGKATVWVVEQLDVLIRGIGSVEYYGAPTVRKKISGAGSVTSLGNP